MVSRRIGGRLKSLDLILQHAKRVVFGVTYKKCQVNGAVRVIEIRDELEIGLEIRGSLFQRCQYKHSIFVMRKGSIVKIKSDGRLLGLEQRNLKLALRNREIVVLTVHSPRPAIRPPPQQQGHYEKEYVV
ncbi:MAG: hypothetical protein Q9222_002816 [Ikaeria aurantiellina]